MNWIRKHPQRFVWNRLLVYGVAMGLVFWTLSVHGFHPNHQGHVHDLFQHDPSEHMHDSPTFKEKPKTPFHPLHLEHHLPVSEQLLHYFKNEAMVLNTCAFLLAALPVSLPLLFPSSLSKFLETLLVSFASGSLLGDLFLHTFPSIATNAWMYFLAGFLLFYYLQRILFLLTGHSCHSHGATSPGKETSKPTSTSLPPPTVLLHVLATLVHTFTNGMLLALAFRQGLPQGLSGFLALLFHELPHRFSDFTLLQTLGASNAFAKKIQLLIALSTLAGSQVVHLVPPTYFTVLLPMATGGLMYIATTTILPILIHTNVSGLKGAIFLVFEAISMATGIWIMMQFGHNH